MANSIPKDSMIDQWKEVKEELVLRFAELKDMAHDEVSIDEFRLDDESIRTPKLHSKFLGILGDEALKLKQIQNLYKKIYLDRWKAYNGKQTDKYYQTYGIIHEKVLKSELNMYLDADEYICELKEIVDIQTQIVDFLEKTIKEINSRTFHLKNAIDWRRFESGG